MVEAASNATVRISASSETGGHLSGGVLSTTDITFMVLAVAAPMAVVVATMPLAFALGNGPGVAGTYLLVAVAMALFAVGYVRLLPHVRNAGAFYAIITLAFGRPSGLGAAYVALTSYISLCCATLGAFSFFAVDLMSRMMGLEVHWATVAIFTIVLLGILSYYRITLAARILEIALTAEVVAIVALDIVILATHNGSYSLAPFTPSAVFAPGIGIAAIYGFNSCVGFEGTAIYQEEARNRDYSIPRATYAAVAIIGIFYVFTAWCLSIAVGPAIAAVAGKDPGHFVLSVATQSMGLYAGDALSVLVTTSAFAAVLGLFNNSSRYLFALARDGVLPRFAARTHPVYGSPYCAGIPILALMVLVVLGFAIAGGDPLLALATSLTGLGSVGLMALLACTAFAIPIYFVGSGIPHKMLPAVVCPALGAVMISVGVVLSIRNYSALTGSTSPVINALPWFAALLATVGVGQALWLKQRIPETYARIGSSRVDG